VIEADAKLTDLLVTLAAPHHPPYASPFSTSRRTASGRVGFGSGCAAIHSSMRSRAGRTKRTLTASLSTFGRPRVSPFLALDIDMSIFIALKKTGDKRCHDLKPRVLARNGQSNTSPMPRQPLGIGLMFASTRSGIGPNAEVVNKRLRLGLYSLDLVALATYPR